MKSPCGATTAAGVVGGMAAGLGVGSAAGLTGVPVAGGGGADRPHDDTAATLSTIAPAAQARATSEVTVGR